MRYAAEAFLPRHSADVEWRVVDTESDNYDVVVIVDPNGIYADASELAHEIAKAMNTCRVMD